MALTKQQKEAIVLEYGKDAKNTGSTEVQIALLTAEIKQLNEHLAYHIHDFSSRRGLLTKVGQRRSLLNYLESKDSDAYKALCEKLGLRY
ncbi:MAG: 30S ribosomal protein S15 [Anaeroplasmataceae bacterium]